MKLFVVFFLIPIISPKGPFVKNSLRLGNKNVHHRHHNSLPFWAFNYTFLRSKAALSPNSPLQQEARHLLEPNLGPIENETRIT